MTDRCTHSHDKAQSIIEVATMLGIQYRKGVDTFGRPFLDIPVEGMQLIHDTALELGHPLVAQDVRHMLAHAPRVED